MALKNRPELNQLRAERLVAAANLAFAKNQRMPQLDLGVGVTATGFSGVPNNLAAAPFFQTQINQINAINSLINLSNASQTPANQIPIIVPNFGTTPAYQTGKLGQSYQNLCRLPLSDL